MISSSETPNDAIPICCENSAKPGFESNGTCPKSS